VEPREQQIWALEFVQTHGSDWMGGFVRLELRPDAGVAWYWAYLVGPDLGLVAVRDHEVPLPRQPGPVVVRAEGLWAELVCETADEHWSIGLEAFGVRLDDPADGFRGEIGERLAVGLDLEWEVPDEPGSDEPGPDNGRSGAVFGEVLIGRDRIAFDGTGVFSQTRGGHPWATTAGVQAERGPDGLPTSVSIGSGQGRVPIEVLAMAAIPIDGPDQRPDPRSNAGADRLVRVLGRWTDDDGATNLGWVDLVEPSS